MAETRNSAGREDGSSFKKVLSDIGVLKQSVDKSVRRTDDVLRKYNSAKRSADGDEQAAVLSQAKSSGSSSGITKKDVTDAVSAANNSTAKRLDELFGAVKTASAKPVAEVPTKKEEVGKKAESAKKVAAKPDNTAKITALVTGAVAAGVAKSVASKKGSAGENVAVAEAKAMVKTGKLNPSESNAPAKKTEQTGKKETANATDAKKAESPKKDSGKTKTQERLEELFGEAKTRRNESAARLDELFGQANTKLTGVDKSINEIKEPILKKLSMNIGEKLLQLVMSPPGLLMISFVAGFIKGWLEQQPWFQFVKKLFQSKIVKAILGGAVIALLLNHLTGGLLGAIAKPLLGLMGKGIGKLLLKGIPMLLKGGLGLVKGLGSLLMNPVGASIAALAAGIAIGYAGFKFISNKLQKMREEETKKINEKASTFKSAEETKKQNQSQIEKLKAGDGGEQFMQVRNSKGGFDTVKGHFDADGNFVVVEQMDASGSFKAVEPDTVGIQAADVAKNTKKMSFNWIAQSKKGITRVQFGQIEAGVRRMFMRYVDTNYCKTGELPAGTSTKLMSALKIMSAHYSVEGEGLNNDDGEAGLKKQLAETWETLNQVVQSYEPGFTRLSQFVKNYQIVYGKIVGYMVPKSNRGAIMAAVQSEKFLFEKNYLQSDDWNHIAFAATVYQIWLDIFLNFMNKEFKTDFKSNTISKAEYDEAMANKDGVQSQALALSTSLATQVRTDNADKAKRDAVKIEAAKKKAADKKKKQDNVQKITNPDGSVSYKHSDGTDATPDEIAEYDKSHPDYKEMKDSSASPFSTTVTKDDMDRLFNKLDKIDKNSTDAANSSKRAEHAGTAAAVTSAMGAKKGRNDGRSADGKKVK